LHGGVGGRRNQMRRKLTAGDVLAIRQRVLADRLMLISRLAMSERGTTVAELLPVAKLPVETAERPILFWGCRPGQTSRAGLAGLHWWRQTSATPPRLMSSRQITAEIQKHRRRHESIDQIIIPCFLSMVSKVYYVRRRGDSPYFQVPCLGTRHSRHTGHS
jgi:hypothetical protein